MMLAVKTNINGYTSLKYFSLVMIMGLCLTARDSLLKRTMEKLK